MSFGISNNTNIQSGQISLRKFCVPDLRAATYLNKFLSLSFSSEFYHLFHLLIFVKVKSWITAPITRINNIFGLWNINSKNISRIFKLVEFFVLLLIVGSGLVPLSSSYFAFLCPYTYHDSNIFYFLYIIFWE